MQNQTRKEQKKGPRGPATDSDSTENPGTQSPATSRHYDSGKNPDMQVQQSNRQGDGKPTQQGRNDR